MKTITNTDLETLIEVKELLERSGFKIAVIDTVKRFAKYDVTAIYGDTNEIYAITVDALNGTYTVEYKVERKVA